MFSETSSAGVLATVIPVAVVPILTRYVTVCTTLRDLTVRDVFLSTTTSRGDTVPPIMPTLASLATVITMLPGATMRRLSTLFLTAMRLVEVGCVTTARITLVSQKIKTFVLLHSSTHTPTCPRPHPHTLYTPTHTLHTHGHSYCATIGLDLVHTLTFVMGSAK